MLRREKERAEPREERRGEREEGHYGSGPSPSLSWSEGRMILLFIRHRPLSSCIEGINGRKGWPFSRHPRVILVATRSEAGDFDFSCTFLIRRLTHPMVFRNPLL